MESALKGRNSVSCLAATRAIGRRDCDSLAGAKARTGRFARAMPDVVSSTVTDCNQRGREGHRRLPVEHPPRRRAEIFGYPASAPGKLGKASTMLFCMPAAGPRRRPRPSIGTEFPARRALCRVNRPSRPRGFRFFEGKAARERRCLRHHHFGRGGGDLGLPIILPTTPDSLMSRSSPSQEKKKPGPQMAKWLRAANTGPRKNPRQRVSPGHGSYFKGGRLAPLRETEPADVYHGCPPPESNRPPCLLPAGYRPMLPVFSASPASSFTPRFGGNSSSTARNFEPGELLMNSGWQKVASKCRPNSGPNRFMRNFGSVLPAKNSNYQLHTFSRTLS